MTQEVEQIKAQFLQDIIPALMAAYMAIWVISQIIKLFKGQDIEKPF